MEEQKTKLPLPPYLSWRTFYNYVQSLKQTMLDRIDPSGMLTLSGTNRNMVINALRFFQLIDGGGKPQENLRAWVAAMSASDRETEKKVLRKVIEAAYPTLFQTGFNLKGASPALLSEKFKMMKLGADTARKAETFFIEAAKEAGIDVSPVILTARRKGRKVGSINAPRKQSQKGKQSHIEDSGGGSDLGEYEELPKWYGTFKPAFDKLPKFENPHWTKAERDAWITAMSALLDLYIKLDDKGGGKQ